MARKHGWQLPAHTLQVHSLVDASFLASSLFSFFFSSSSFGSGAVRVCVFVTSVIGCGIRPCAVVLRGIRRPLSLF